MHADGAPQEDLDAERLRFYTAPEVVRLLTALAGGPLRTAHLGVVVGCRWDETERALLGLQRRWMVIHERGGYRLTRSGHLLAVRLISCATALYRELYSRPGLSLPPTPLVIEGVLDDIGRLTEPAYLRAFQKPDQAGAEMKTWMISYGYAHEEGGTLALTRTGGAYRSFLDRCVRTIATIDRFNSFFEEHDLDGIPEFAVKRIGDLAGGAHAQYLPANSKRGYEYYLEIVREARTIHGVSTFSLPFLAEILWERVLAGTVVELIITPELAAPLWREEFVGSGRDNATFPNFGLFVATVPIAVGLTVTDRALSLGLFFADGTYDTVHDLIGRSPGAVAWGERLFRYYKDRALPIDEFFRNRENTVKSAPGA